MRQRFRMYAYLPLTADFALCEVDLSEVVSRTTLKVFATELSERRLQRARRAQYELKYERYHEHISSAQTFNIANTAEFPLMAPAQQHQQAIATPSAWPSPAPTGGTGTSADAAAAATAATVAMATDAALSATAPKVGPAQQLQLQLAWPSQVTPWQQSVLPNGAAAPSAPVAIAKARDQRIIATCTRGSRYSVAAATCSQAGATP